MRKVILAVIFIGIPIYLFDWHIHSWAQTNLDHTVEAVYPGAKTQSNVGGHYVNLNGHSYMPKPMLYQLVVQNKLKNVSVDVSQGRLLIANLPISSWHFEADEVSFDSKQMFDDKRVISSGVSGGMISASASEVQLSQLKPSARVVIDGPDNSTVDLGSGAQKLNIEVTDTDIVFKAGDTEFARVKYINTPLMPCKPDVQYFSDSVIFQCPTAKVPGVLSGGVSS